jgi:NAD(P)-dependent dehydrogenase (short-subunit alcohol dehydrogenase family)
MSGFRDAVAVVTGGASGIGEALGRELGRRGARVVLVDRNAELLRKVVEAQRAQGRQVTGAELDVTDFASVEQVLDATAETEGRIDYLFNVAGVFVIGEARDVPIEDWRKTIDVNLNGVINGVVAALPIMTRQGFGHLVNMASGEGLCPFPGTAAYVASKFAVVGLSGSLWMELHELGIDVSVVCPGFVKTPLLAKPTGMHNADYQAWYDSLKPVQRFAVTPQLCAERILKGVAKKKHIIISDVSVRPFWWLNRLSPGLYMKSYTRLTRKTRQAMRKVDARAAPQA